MGDINNENIISTLQSLQSLEKNMHNKLNNSIIMSTESIVEEWVHVGSSKSNSKTVNLPANIIFNTVDGVGYTQRGSEWISAGVGFTTEIITSGDSTQKLKVYNPSSGSWWEPNIYLKGTGYTADSKYVDTSLNKQEQEELIKEINKVADTRIGLFKTLNDQTANSVAGATNARNDLVHQITALKIVEGEMANAKRHLRKLKTEKNNKLRMSELSMYESDKYRAYVKLFKVMLFIAIPIAVLFFALNINFFKSPESNSGYRLLLKDIVIIAIATLMVYGIYKFVYNVLDLSMRNNMNFNAYDFDFDEGDAPSISAYNEKQWKKIKGELTSEYDKITDTVSEIKDCLGPHCCATGTVWNNKKGKCIGQTEV